MSIFFKEIPLPFLDKVNIISKWKEIPKQNFTTVVELDIVAVQDFQLRKEIYVIIQLLSHFGKKVDSRNHENKQVIGSLLVISDIIDEYDVEFLDEQRRIRLKTKSISQS